MSATAETVQVGINQSRLLKALGDSFTRPMNIVTELCQNSRRAGATRIEITLSADGTTLRIVDNGKGIKDFRPLLTIGESGWDAEVLESDNPFGIGWLSCLCGARYVEVVSGTRQLCASTKTLLDMTPVTIQSAKTPVLGTDITLSGVKSLNGGKIGTAQIEEALAGFPVEVMLNGNPLPRRYAEKVLAKDADEVLFETDYGVGYVQRARLLAGEVSRVGYYLQGLPVSLGSSSSLHRADVIFHLDSRRVRARVPDRDVLLDKDTVLEALEEATRTFARKYVVAHLTDKPDEERIKFMGVLRKLGDVRYFNAVNLLPALMLTPADSDAFIVLEYNRESVGDIGASHFSAPVSRADVEGGKVKLVLESELNGLDEEDHESCSAVCRYLAALEYEVLADGGLDKDHWAIRAAAPISTMLDKGVLTIESNKRSRKVDYPGYGEVGKMYVCAHVKIRGPLGLATVREGFLIDEAGDLAVIGKERGYGIATAFDSFYNGDNYHYDDNAQADMDDLITSALSSLRNRSPAALIQDALSRRSSELKPWAGKRLTLTIGSKGEVKVSVLKARKS